MNFFHHCTSVDLMFALSCSRRQMSGGRFLIGLRELECSERIIAITTLLKESIDFWKDDVHPDEDQSASILWLNSELDKISDDIDACTLDDDAVQVSAVIAGYAARKVIMERSGCAECKEMAISTTGIEEMENENKYLQNLSRGGLIIATTDLRHHIEAPPAVSVIA